MIIDTNDDDGDRDNDWQLAFKATMVIITGYKDEDEHRYQ